MPRYKTPDGNGLDIGGEHFAADADGCITVPDGNYHTLLAPLGCELQPDSAPIVEPVAAQVVEPVAEAVVEPIAAAESDTAL